MSSKKLTKIQIAKSLGISRPTLYKKMKAGEKINLPELDIQSQKTCIYFSANFPHISPKDLEEVLELLQDYGFLNDEGIVFRSNYWSLFIKE